MEYKGQDVRKSREISLSKSAQKSDLVLDKDIFSVLFDKDIRRVYIYKKADRLVKALHMIRPGFSYSVAIRDKIDAIAVGIIDAAVLPPQSSRDTLARHLLALSSILDAACESGTLSPMNAGILMREAHALLGEVCEYEEPGIALSRVPTIADLDRATMRRPAKGLRKNAEFRDGQPFAQKSTHKGHIYSHARCEREDHTARSSGARKERTCYRAGKEAVDHLRSKSSRNAGNNLKTRYLLTFTPRSDTLRLLW